MTDFEKQQFLERMAAEIGEHFDCVQILAHDSDSESYTEYEAGSGSLFARQYQAMRWSEDSAVTVDFEEEDDDDDDDDESE
jgi:hypothetical protein